MKEIFFLGRKNQRTNHNVYKRVINKNNPVNKERWFVASIKRGKFVGWNHCNQIPMDMKAIRKQTAEEHIFLFCL